MRYEGVIGRVSLDIANFSFLKFGKHCLYFSGRCRPYIYVCSEQRYVAFHCEVGQPRLGKGLAGR